MTTYDASALTNVAIAHKQGITIQQGRAGMRDNLLACMETDSTAPINQTAWHPYDLGTGVIYDSAVDGSVASVTTPTLSPNFEYKIEAFNVGHDTATASLSVALYTAGASLFGSLSTSGSISAADTLARNYVRFYAGNGNANFPDVITSRIRNAVSYAIVSWNTANLDQGQLILLRRADYSFR